MPVLYFTKSVLLFLLSDSTIYPHFSLSAETYPLISFFMSRRQTTAISLLSWLLNTLVPMLPVASLTLLKTGHTLDIHIAGFIVQGAIFAFDLFNHNTFSYSHPLEWAFAVSFTY